jgi:hypothetical protein
MIKSSFSSYLHDKVRIILIREGNIDVDKIFCQYNPDKFHLYSQVVYKLGNPLSIYNSPHYKLLKLIQSLGRDKLILHIQNTDYWKMQKLYGRDDKWIMGKIDKFINLYISIQNGTIIDSPEILDKPIVTNQYNDKFEIWEGHHRMAAFAALGLTTVKCNLYRWEEDE